jgi:hypothetical protein
MADVPPTDDIPIDGIRIDAEEPARRALAGTLDARLGRRRRRAPDPGAALRQPPSIEPASASDGSSTRLNCVRSSSMP